VAVGLVTIGTVEPIVVLAAAAGAMDMAALEIITQEATTVDVTRTAGMPRPAVQRSSQLGATARRLTAAVWQLPKVK